MSTEIPEGIDEIFITRAYNGRLWVSTIGNNLKKGNIGWSKESDIRSMGDGETIESAIADALHEMNEMSTGPEKLEGE